MASQPIDTKSFHLTADPQLSSPFFSLLPAEIRNLIYVEFWHLSSSRQHIIFGPYDPPVVPEWSHLPCITDPCAEDIRMAKYAAENDSGARTVWGARLKSEWCLHWACEEEGKDRHVAAAGRAGSIRSSTRTGFLDVLRTCKRMYIECLPSLYSNTTFVFTNTNTAAEFLALYSEDTERHPLRSLELCIRAANILTEIYYPTGGPGGDEGPPAVFAGRARPFLSMQNNPWQRVCDYLIKLRDLQELRIWFDSSDLRPWHKRVSETRFFGKLFDVRVPDKSRFVLGLPELPARRGPDAQLLEGQYLEGENLEHAPFTVERGPRPNNWLVHFHQIGVRQTIGF
ncbi:hypothetical protein C8A03DRAFT_31344 [Achaetomium macrosporum]|uniref:DUF7730 domain-containing protein n=1 Tax=Achaetomium macrosporum TaxID=79813 RepID=A0AAN7H8X3_9PEZI|nr:hypothetical protein C8A03DRAFT_31344 [Achaetomium macrosporum]